MDRPLHEYRQTPTLFRLHSNSSLTLSSCPPNLHHRQSPVPGWLELASVQLDRFGPDDLAELQDDAVVAALHDQIAAGLDVITDGEQTRLDFNLSFYGYIRGIDLESAPPRRLDRRRTTSAGSIA